MGEKETLTVGILELMEGMTPEEIEGYKSEWLKTIQKKDIEMYSRVIEFVDCVCEVAIKRAYKEVLA